MTDRRPPTSDQFLVAWFEDGPTSMPDRVLDAVADRIGRQRQRRSWRLPWRLSMNSALKLAAGLATVLVLAVVGYTLLPKSNVGPPASPSIAPTPTPVPTAVACDGGTAGCHGVLDGGTYSSMNFRPKLTYTVPAGDASIGPISFWKNPYDMAGAYTLVPAHGSAYSFQVVSDIAIPEQTADCSAKLKAGVGNSVTDWVSFLTTHPGLDAKAPVAVTIGGFSGFRVDFARASTWKASCPDSVGPAIIVITNAGQTGVRWTDDQQETFWILDVSGQTVLITLDSSPSVAAHAADLESAQPIIDSFHFNP